MKKNLFWSPAFKGLLAICLVIGNASYTQAQDAIDTHTSSTWNIGVGGGFRASSMSYSDLSTDLFPTRKPITSGTFSIFVLGEFGTQRNFAIRPQLSIVKRGGMINDIYQDTYALYNSLLKPSDPQLTNISYTVKATYLDFRLPLIYQFLKHTSTVRPYAMLEPRLGFAMCGDINLREEYGNQYNAIGTDASKANLASVHFGLAIGAGVRFNIPVAHDRVFIGVEASYEIGISNTYGSKEKEGKAFDISGQYSIGGYELSGSRRFNGFELGAVLGIPFTMFKKKAPQPVATILPPPIPVVEEAPSKPCYTFEEINDMLQQGQSVVGKTICAVDDINFDFGKSNIKEESYSYLNQIANFLINSGVHVTVNGHTDNVGTEAFNMQLSQDRAKAVVAYLVSKGVSEKKISYQYFGATRPLNSNDTAEGRTMNRRVEFVLSK